MGCKKLFFKKRVKKFSYPVENEYLCTPKQVEQQLNTKLEHYD